MLFGLTSFAVSSLAQVEKETGRNSLFEGEEKLQIKLSADFTSLLKNKEDENYIPALISIRFSKKDAFERELRLKPRGYYRKMNCGFPPLMLNFKPDTLIVDDGKYVKVKLVSHCYDSDTYRDYVLKEYLIYKLYALISPYSLRVRMADIEYRDTGKRERNVDQLGFLIEPMDVFCERTDVIEIEGKYFNDAEINELEADRVAIFMYMIGNTDWRIKSGHNIKFLKIKNHRKEEVVPVPYDFDHAGLINTSYALPSEWSEAERVTERDFTGRCRTFDTNYDVLIEDFLKVKEQMLKTINEFEYLELKQRKRVFKFVEDFYEELEKPERFKRNLHNSCMDRY
ncbi:hypothetical protein J1N11_01360 [Marinilabiliaceae bacterium N1Y90]|nr:hypothetical protein [Marinilabiliaceae bacterium N1Y90]